MSLFPFPFGLVKIEEYIFGSYFIVLKYSSFSIFRLDHLLALLGFVFLLVSIMCTWVMGPINMLLQMNDISYLC